jgi:hypothetical protein
LPDIMGAREVTDARGDSIRPVRNDAAKGPHGRRSAPVPPRPSLKVPEQ